MSPELPGKIYGRLFSAAFFLSCVVVLGASTYFHIGGGRWSWFDCLYMTVITISTVGFSELLDGMHTLTEARILTLVLIVVGSGTLLYFVSNVTAVIIEGDLQGLLRRRRMDKRILNLEQHVILCGAGSTGEHIARELVAINKPCVVIERDEARIVELNEELRTELPHVIGDATDDHTLEKAGIRKASGIIAALHNDKDNLFITISARALNANARIVAKAVELSSEAKLLRAGANSIVSPNRIGGMRLVSEMIRPHTVEFLDRMLRARDQNLRIEDARVPEGSSLVGRTLAEVSIRDTGALVIAVRLANGEYVYNPSSDLRIEAGASLIVIAHADEVARLRDGLKMDTLVPPPNNISSSDISSSDVPPPSDLTGPHT